MILGLHVSHNSSVCLIDEQGQVVFATAEERLSRRKNDTGFPTLGLRHILENWATPKTIKAVVIGDRCLANYHSAEFADFMYLQNLRTKDRWLKSPLKLSRLVAGEILPRAFRPSQSDYKDLVKERLKPFLPDTPVYFIDHHLAHAASAYYCSPFEKALILTLDGSGNEASGLVMTGAGYKMTEHSRLKEADSFGNYYKSIVAVLGFMPGSHEGKITGLAAYGDPKRFYEKFQKLLHLSVGDQGEIRVQSVCAEMTNTGFALSDLQPLFLLKNHAADYFKARHKGWDEFRKLGLQRHFKKLYRDLLQIDAEKLTTFQDKADLAAAAQAVLEETILDYIRHFLKKYPEKNLTLAGGVFANVKLNQKILEQTSIEQIYIHPAMGDEGLSVGAAKIRYHNQNKSGPAFLKNVSLGARGQNCEELLQKYDISYEKLDLDKICLKAVAALKEEKLVALYSASTEYGPRALGHRTILVNPSRNEVNQTVNAKLRRTEFMPFAPVVLEDDFEKIFESSKIKGSLHATRFMTITLNVRENYRQLIPAVVHVDGTARPQVINSENGLYYSILKEFREQTGIPALVNTSFNMHEEPIVNSAEDAIRAFVDGQLDHLILENFWCKRPS